MYCYFCGARTHTRKNCPQTWDGQRNRMRMRCSYCGSRKHNTNACPKTYNGSAVRAWYSHTVEDDFIED